MPDLGQINVNIGADTKRLEQGLNKSKSELKDFEGKVSMGAGKLALFTGAAIAGAAALRGLGQFLVSSIKLSADLAETQSKFATVFDQSSKKVDALASSFGILSKGEAQGFLATTGAILRGAGLAGDQVDNLASQVGELARDFSSFNNVPVAETFTAINAAITGEREQLKRLGIVLREADVQQRALEQSGKDSAKALTQQEKAVATLALITEQATVQVGDYARTSGSAANQGKQLETNLKNLQEAFAEGLEPAVRATVTSLNELASSRSLQDYFRDLGSTIGNTTAVIIQNVQDTSRAFREMIALAQFAGGFGLGGIGAGGGSNPFTQAIRIFNPGLAGQIDLFGAAQNAEQARQDYLNSISGFRSNPPTVGISPESTTTSGGSSGGGSSSKGGLTVGQQLELLDAQNRYNAGLDVSRSNIDALNRDLVDMVASQEIGADVSFLMAESMAEIQRTVDNIELDPTIEGFQQMEVTLTRTQELVAGALANGFTEVFSIITDGTKDATEKLEAVGKALQNIIRDLGRALVQAELLDLIRKGAWNPTAFGIGAGLLLFGGLLGGRRSTPRVNTSLGRPAPQPSSQLVASVGIDQIHFALERYKSENFLA